MQFPNRSIPPAWVNVTDAGTSLRFTGIVVFMSKDDTFPNRLSTGWAQDRDHMIARRQAGLSPGEVTDFSIINSSGTTPITDFDDEQLIALVDRNAAFAVLYDRYAASILRYCRLRIGNLHDAEDTTASILLKAFAGFPPDQRSTFRAWLFTIAHHTVVDFYRRSARTPESTLDLDAAHHVPDNAPTPEEHVLRDNDSAMLRRAMAVLNDDQRQVVELRLSGLKGAEIASVIGRSPNAMKMLQHRALQHLKRELTPTSTSKEPLDAS